MNTTIKSKRLVNWLVTHGADIDMVYNFVLEKGMGERIEVWIVDEGRVQLTWMPQPSATKLQETSL